MKLFISTPPCPGIGCGCTVAKVTKRGLRCMGCGGRVLMPKKVLDIGVKKS